MIEGPLPIRLDGDVKRFERHMLLRSAMYLRCILLDSYVFSKGAPHWVHGMSEGYHRCLFGLQDLSKFHAIPNFAALHNRDFLKLLGGRGATPAADAIGDGVAEDPHYAIGAPAVGPIEDEDCIDEALETVEVDVDNGQLTRIPVEVRPFSIHRFGEL